jgi:type I restriction enzyme, S subunit
MGLRPGYKQTEVGVIPEDWQVANLASVSSERMQNGVFYEPSRKGAGIKLINVGDLYRRTPIDSDSLELFDADQNEKERFKVEDGDLFFTRSSVVPSGIAHCNIYRQSGREAVVFDSHIIRLRPNAQTVVPTFLHQFCAASIARKYLISRAKTATMTTIDQSVLAECPVPVPDKTEQEAIAEALRDNDALVGSTEQLIAKKRHIKKGAMQELLTGKKRLPGFVGEWALKPLRDVCRAINDGTHVTPQYVSSGVPFYSVENVTANDFTNTKFISHGEHAELIKRCRPEKGDILLTRIGALGETKLIDWDVDASIYVSLALLKPKHDTDPRYLYCYTKSRKFVEDIEDRSLLNASPKKINMAEIGGVPVTIPPNQAEQTAIANTLSDMDGEIAALEAKLAKVRHIKQGMMQNLLTGKIRLV